MNENKIEIPESEFKRNKIFLKLEDLLNTSINPTLTLDKGDVVLQQFSLYGEEEIENA
jgi:Fe-S cluster biogenesis protein NfuA